MQIVTVTPEPSNQLVGLVELQHREEFASIVREPSRSDIVEQLRQSIEAWRESDSGLATWNVHCLTRAIDIIAGDEETFQGSVSSDSIPNVQALAEVVGITQQEMLSLIFKDAVKSARDSEWLSVMLACGEITWTTLEAAAEVVPRVAAHTYPDPNDVRRDGFRVVEWESGEFGIEYDQETVDQVHNIVRDSSYTWVNKPVPA